MGVSVNVQLMLLVFVLFIAAVYLLNKWLYQPILGFMDARDDMIKNDLANVDGNDSEMEAIDNEIHSILDAARKEATAIKESATLAAKEEYAKNIEMLKTENDNNLNVFLESMQQEKEALKATLLSQMPEFQASIKNKLQHI